MILGVAVVESMANQMCLNHNTGVISTPENWLLTKEVEIMTEIFALCEMHSPT